MIAVELLTLIRNGWPGAALTPRIDVKGRMANNRERIESMAES